MPGLTPVKKSVLYRVTTYFFFFYCISIIAADHLDGPFIQALRDTELLFRGSSNQRIIYLHGNPDADIIPGTVETIPLK